MRSTKFWIILFSAILLLSAAGAVYVSSRTVAGATAKVYQNGECIHSIDLSQVEEAYTILISGDYENTILVEPGRICVGAASCPDGVCVHQGWISNGVIPIVCLPNKLTIEIENAPEDGFDAVTR